MLKFLHDDAQNLMCGYTWWFSSEQSVDTVVHERDHRSAMAFLERAKLCSQLLQTMHHLKAGYTLRLQWEHDFWMGEFSSLPSWKSLQTNICNFFAFLPWRRWKMFDIFRKKHFWPYQFCAPFSGSMIEPATRLLSHPGDVPWDARVN